MSVPRRMRRFIRVAAQGGAEQHPVWDHPLIESRTVTLVRSKGESEQWRLRRSRPRRGRAFGIDASSRDPGYALYQARTERQMPVLDLRLVRD